MSSRFKNSQHVWRVAGLFLAGFLLFVIVRARLVPDDFGVYGFYRAGALADAKALPLVHAGEGDCVVCHSEVDDLRKENRHKAIKCESCHGPLWKHVQDTDVKPATLDPRGLCVACHTKAAGKYDGFPQIVIAAHQPDRPCTDCHAPHRPRAEKKAEGRR